MDRRRSSETIARLERKVKEARTIYDGCKVDVGIARNRILDSRPMHPDRSLALTDSLQREAQARKDYVKAIKTFSHYVMDGEVSE